jgi:four helix bundle protein
MQDFKRLRVWKQAAAVAMNVRRTSDGFPRFGYAELKAQMISAAESMLFNIVEGCGTDSQREFARFLTIAIKSATELEGQLDQAKKYEILSEPDWHSLTAETIDTRRMLYGLRKKVLASGHSQRPRPPPSPSQSLSHATTRNASRATRTDAGLTHTSQLNATHNGRPQIAAARSRNRTV